MRMPTTEVGSILYSTHWHHHRFAQSSDDTNNVKLIATVRGVRAAEAKLQDVLMGDISKRRSCMYDMVTMNSDMENIAKDALERRSRTHLVRSSILRSQCGATLWLPRRPPTFYCSRAVAGRNEEAWKIDASRCGRQ